MEEIYTITAPDIKMSHLLHGQHSIKKSDFTIRDYVTEFDLEVYTKYFQEFSKLYYESVMSTNCIEQQILVKYAKNYSNIEGKQYEKMIYILNNERGVEQHKNIQDRLQVLRNVIEFNCILLDKTNSRKHLRYFIFNDLFKINDYEKRSNQELLKNFIAKVRLHRNLIKLVDVWIKTYPFLTKHNIFKGDVYNANGHVAYITPHFKKRNNKIIFLGVEDRKPQNDKLDDSSILTNNAGLTSKVIDTSVNTNILENTPSNSNLYLPELDMFLNKLIKFSNEELSHFSNKNHISQLSEITELKPVIKLSEYIHKQVIKISKELNTLNSSQENLQKYIDNHNLLHIENFEISVLHKIHNHLSFKDKSRIPSFKAMQFLKQYNFDIQFFKNLENKILTNKIFNGLYEIILDLIHMIEYLIAVTCKITSYGTISRIIKV